MSEEIDKLKAQNAELIQKNAELERELATFKAKPKQQFKNDTEREIFEILKFLGDTSATMSIGQIAGHFGLKESIAEHHIAVLGAQNCIISVPSIARLRTTGADMAYKISPHGTSVLLNSPAT